MLSKLESLTSKEKQLKSETLLTSPQEDGIHEGQVSLTHGFVPFQPISSSLPEKYRAWEELSKNLPRYLSEGTEREYIKKLPLLSVDDVETLPNEFLSRAIAMIGNFAHAYYFNQRLGQVQETDPLPESVLIPWQQLTKRIQRKLPPDSDKSIEAVRIHYDTFLTNWSLHKPGFEIDGKHNKEITLRDLSILNPIFGNKTEDNFNLTFVIMELRFAPALRHINNALNAVLNKDDDTLIKALQGITSAIEDVTNGLDYINPNPHSVHHVDPTVWTKTVAKLDGKIPGGISGLSGSAMPLFHTLDIFIERQNYSSAMGEGMVKKYKHQPTRVHDYLDALRSDLNLHSIRKYVEASRNPVLKNQYDLLREAYLGEQGLLGVHASKVYGYMKINFRNGRLQTNGGHDGTSTVATEPQRHIYDDFADADIERVGGYIPAQQFAKKIGMKVYPNKTAVIDLDVSHTALQFQPGDHCAIRPINSPEAIRAQLWRLKQLWTAKIELNKAWKEFFLRHLNCKINTVELGELLTHVDFSSLSVSDNSELKLDQLKPLAPRYYSVSPDASCPQHLRLTIGRHDEPGKPLGLCSSYLMSDAQIFAIERAPARHFHLPQSNETPVLMFAAGTGISPFMGFIDERAKTAPKSKNYLFYSTPTLETFYHHDELGKAVVSGNVDLSVIFSKDKTCNTGSFDLKGQFIPAIQYKGNHVDQLIKARSKAIADLIVKEKGQIYICGNPGFADSVRAEIISALSEHTDIPNPTGYVDTMIADFRFNSDVYASTNHSQKYPSLFASKIAMHNKPDDCWGVINGSVYDLTRFAHIHPGGPKIIAVNGGIDMSADFNYIKHNQQPQIMAMLEQYKIGVLASPVLANYRSVQFHGYSKQLVEALTEMENTLRNNTTYGEKVDQTYLWREVYSVFVDGSLASYRKPGSGNAGSLNYVLGPLLKKVCDVAVYTVSEDFESNYSSLITNASELGNYIRQSSIGPLSSEELEMKKKSFELVLGKTFEFIAQLKTLALDILYNIEEAGDDYDLEFIQEKLAQIEKEMKQHAFVLKHMIAVFSNADKDKPISASSVPVTTVGCIYAHQLQVKAPPSSIPSSASLSTRKPAATNDLAVQEAMTRVETATAARSATSEHRTSALLTKLGILGGFIRQKGADDPSATMCTIV